MKHSCQARGLKEIRRSVNVTIDPRGADRFPTSQTSRGESGGRSHRSISRLVGVGVGVGVGGGGGVGWGWGWGLLMKGRSLHSVSQTKLEHSTSLIPHVNTVLYLT